jgi:hypothetical protein
MPFRHQATKRWFIRVAGCVVVAAALPLLIVTAQGQDGRYTNSQYGISFQPPAGYTPENLVRYHGQPRADGTWPVLTLIADDSLVDLSDKGIDALSKDMRDTLAEQGMDAIQVADRRKRNVAGFDAWQMDLTYKRGAASIRQRQVYVPIGDHKRTYLFTFIDAAQHFDESVAAAESAIASFVPSASAGAGDETKKGGAGPYTLPLIILGAIALAIIITATYLLTRKRPAVD